MVDVMESHLQDLIQNSSITPKTLSQVSHSKQPATKFYEQSDVQCLSVWGETELSYQQPRMNMEADRQPLHMPAALAHDPTPSS